MGVSDLIITHFTSADDRQPGGRRPKQQQQHRRSFMTYKNTRIHYMSKRFDVVVVVVSRGPMTAINERDNGVRSGILYFGSGALHVYHSDRTCAKEDLCNYFCLFFFLLLLWYAINVRTRLSEYTSIEKKKQ